MGHSNDTDLNGLTSEEVLAQRKLFGSNELPGQEFSWFSLLLRQFRGIFNALLLAAAVLALLLGEYLDSGFILFLIIFSGLLGFFQEYKSNKATSKLRQYLQRTCSVQRDHQQKEIPLGELVPGDIVFLEPGDIVPADMEILETADILINETAFTGESLPVSKEKKQENITSDRYTLLQGTDVIKGNATARVTQTGIHTRFADIATLATGKEEKSEFAKGLDRFSVFILRMTGITLFFVIAGNIFIEGSSADIPTLIIFAISLAVSVIPEALPLVSTFSLSHGAMKLTREGVVVKKLTSVQDLGSITILCSDKTGTITENKLTLIKQKKNSASIYSPAVLARCAATNLNQRVKEPFDLALEDGITSEERLAFDQFTLQKEESFDPTLRSNGAFLSLADGTTIHIRRGAPEHILKLTDSSVDEDTLTWITKEEESGRRTLAVAYTIDKEDSQLQGGFTFGGLLSFEDTLKPSTKETLSTARDLGIDVRIITGDSLLVAEAIGKEIGLIETADQVILADDLFKLPSHELHEAIDRVKVFSRVSPEQKLTIIELLQERGVVGFLGEGINDAPALKKASVSMVVQSASDIARETADIILLRSDLKVIIEGIRLGRETHVNTMKYIRATLASNFGNFYAVAIGSLFISFLPMLPTQILLLNLLSDFPMIAIALDRVDRRDILKPQKYDLKSLAIIALVLGAVSSFFDFMYFGLFYKISPEVLQTNWFIASVLTEILLLFSIRSMRPAFKAGLPSPLIIFLSLLAFSLTIAIPLIPTTASLFKFTTPTLAHMYIIVGLAFTYLLVTELVKIPLGRFLQKGNGTVS